MGWIKLASDAAQWRSIVEMEMNFQIYRRREVS